MGALLARYEWALMLPLVMAFAVWELRSVTRAQRRARDAVKPPVEPK